MQGFVFGTIIENSDKDHPDMVKVSAPAAIDQSGEAFWAKVLVPYAGNGYGVYFMPEVGDSIVAGFIGESCTPVVMGCILRGVNTPFSQQDENKTKAIHTKGGHKITLTDGVAGSLTIQSATGHSIIISDQDRYIKVGTSDGKNTVLLHEGKGSIEILADKTVSIKAEEILLDGKTLVKGKNVTIEAENQLSMKGCSAVQIDGFSTKITAQTLEAIGQASSKMESCGIFSIKGAMTKIN